jgi:hypothetical protein
MSGADVDWRMNDVGARVADVVLKLFLHRVKVRKPFRSTYLVAFGVGDRIDFGFNRLKLADDGPTPAPGRISACSSGPAARFY